MARGVVQDQVTAEAKLEQASHLNPRLSLMFSRTPPATSATASLALQMQHKVRAMIRCP